ncbi:MAG: tRNA (adenosine(37)-N6)-threonylcarbamoyltransferase complex dimerization subunit type 1 TsaB [Chloroflexota bacterium]|nr:tRNA (adenosine(37)-N6)-threonylcarbamoyltransferase complex dimerization subunit type 1 TsaB [Chloroflexota bacterium]
MELALDTSTDSASIALSHRGDVRGEMTWHAGQNHTMELAPNVLYLLRQGGIGVEALEAVFVARGPGSFNGVRVAMAAAKGLAFALGIPLVGVSTLEIEAFPYADSGLPIYPIQNAGRGEVATATFVSHERRWQRLVAEHISTLPELCAGLTGESILCGPFSRDMVLQIERQGGERAIVRSVVRRAGFLAQLGWSRLESGDTDNPSTLQPLYLRPPAITTRKKREISR